MAWTPGTRISRFPLCVRCDSLTPVDKNQIPRGYRLDLKKSPDCRRGRFGEAWVQRVSQCHHKPVTMITARQLNQEQN
jgi:hypothetical protein